MLVKEKIGQLSTLAIQGATIDRLPLEWYELNKRIVHKQTASGRKMVLKFLNKAPELQQDDVLYADANLVIAIEVLPCEAMVVQPASLYEMAWVCYEIGNKHLPLFYEEGCLLMPYDEPVYRLLTASGLMLQRRQAKLLHPLRTTVAPHAHGGEGRQSLFSKIMQLTGTHES